MPEIRPVGASSKAKLLIHADPGVGKTTLIGSGGHDFRTIIVRPPTDHVDSILGSGCEEIVVRDWEDVTGNDGVLPWLQHETFDPDTWVWLDSISQFQDTGLQDILQGVIDRKGPTRALYGPDKGEYGVNMWRLQKFIRDCVEIESFNFGVTAHSFWYELASEESSDDSYNQIWPWVQGKQMPQKICGMMNIVGFMEARERKVRNETRSYRVIHTRKTSRYYAKDQFNAWDDTEGNIVNPTMPGIVAAIDKVRPRARRATTRRKTRRKGAR